uniref:Uncharacterized protein n=1 Tax=Human herpesvirus 2 TaxID=10310 RepID=A0A481THP8_HHV2|nr:hypothetical protein [Human alphaherpesvirus 2]
MRGPPWSAARIEWPRARRHAIWMRATKATSAAMSKGCSTGRGWRRGPSSAGKRRSSAVWAAGDSWWGRTTRSAAQASVRAVASSEDSRGGRARRPPHATEFS